MKLLVKQLARIEDVATQSRFKRDVFDFISGISKILFGTVGSEDATYYTDKILDVEKQQTNFF
jgi:hypothetical protein